MAKKGSASADATREKAKQMRETQAKADQRARNLVIALVAALIVAIVVAVTLVVMNRPSAEQGGEGLPTQFDEGQPIVVSSAGIDTPTTSSPDLTLYFDYSCGACSQLEIALRPDLFDAAESGDFNLALQPVVTAGAPFNVAATAGALAVAAEVPDLFLQMHEGLIDYFFQAAMTDGDTAYRDLDESLEVVKEIATDMGVPQDVVDSFDPEAAASYLAMATKTWTSTKISGREGPATPEFVTNGAKVPLTGSTAAEVIEELIAAAAK